MTSNLPGAAQRAADLPGRGPREAIVPDDADRLTSSVVQATEGAGDAPSE